MIAMRGTPGAGVANAPTSMFKPSMQANPYLSMTRLRIGTGSGRDKPALRSSGVMLLQKEATRGTTGMGTRAEPLVAPCCRRSPTAPATGRQASPHHVCHADAQGVFISTTIHPGIMAIAAWHAKGVSAARTV